MTNFGDCKILAQPKTIAIANFGEHPALRAGIVGFKAELKKQGLADGSGVVYDDQHINFDRTLIPQLLTNAHSKKPALILAVTTPVAQSSIRVVTDKSIPIVFMSVVDPAFSPPMRCPTNRWALPPDASP